MFDQRLSEAFDAKLSAFSPDAKAHLRESGLLRPFLEYIALSSLVDGRAADAEKLRQRQVEFCQANKISSEDELINYLSSLGVDQDIWINQLSLPIRTQGLAQEMFSAKAESYFLAKKTELDSVSYSLIRVSSQDVAYDLYLKLEDEPMLFEELARTRGEGPEKNMAGKVGPIGLTLGDPILVNHLKSASPGVVSEPMKVKDWWLLVRLDSILPAVFDESMKRKMCQELFKDWLQVQLDLKIKQI